MNIIKAIWQDTRVQTAVKALIIALTGAVTERLLGILDALGGVTGV